MSIRKIFFWTHLVVGCIVGLVVLMMSFTGILLTYEQQIIAWAERDYHQPPLPGAAQLPPARLIALTTDDVADPPSNITWEADPTAPVAVSWGRSKTLYLNRYSGEILGEGAVGLRSFFRDVTGWHRWFAAEGERRNFWRGVTGVSNLGFLFLVLSGMYLWLPKKWSGQSVRAVAWFRGGLSGKARDFNWHNVFGIWCAVPLVFVVATATFFSYSWPSRWLYLAIDGQTPPPRARGASDNEEPIPDPAAYQGLDRHFATASRHNPDWQTITLTVPKSPAESVGFTVAGAGRGRPDLRVSLELDPDTGEVTQVDRFSDQTAGRRARTWVRWIHTGEAGGWIGQTIAGVASLAGVMLVWTGIMLSWRRFSA